MPRPLRELDPDAGPVQRFAHELRELRVAAGNLTYQELARRTRFSLSAISEAARGERLPSLEVTLAFVEACGGDSETWGLRWHAVSAELAADANSQAGEVRSPYRGLAAYEADDAALFFGREELLDDLIARVSNSHFLAVTGTSGLGKSSLLRAGLLPAARSGRIPGSSSAILITPGTNPMQRIVPWKGLLIVDQFEELFTICRGAEERAQFIDQLLTALRADSGRRVVLGMRSDFLGHCARHAELAVALSGATILLGSLTAQQLRSVIVKPAARVGLGVDPALVATIIRDAGDEPGMLPLLSHALLETWRQRRGKQLTLAQYNAVGGLHGAVARTAERVYTELSESERLTARRVFMRLVVPGEGTHDSGRALSLADLSESDHSVLELLVNARLLTQDTDNVRLAHEALLRSWPRFREWIAEEREGLRLHRKLAEAASAWEELGREPAALYRGTRLALARDWAQRAELTPLERSFLAASTAAETVERAFAERRTRRLRLLSGALALLLVVAAGASVLAWNQRRDAVSRMLAAEANASVELDIGRAIRGALDAYEQAATTEARSALLSIAGRRPYTAKLRAHTGMVKSVAFSADSRTLASAGQDNLVHLWDVGKGTIRASLRGHQTAVRTVAYSPDGELIASADRAGRVLVWDAGSATAIRTLTGHSGIVDGVAFSSDGRFIASAGGDRTIVWETATGNKLHELPLAAGPATEVTFNGSTLLIAGGDGVVTMWEPTRPEAIQSLRLSAHALYAVAVNPAGSVLAAAGEDGRVSLWDIKRGVLLAEMTEHTNPVRHLTFSDDGHTLISAGYDHSVVLWDVARRAATVRLTGHASGVYGVAASPDGRFVASAGEDQTVLLWDRSQMPMIGHTNRVSDVAFAPSGNQLASVDQHGMLLIWDLLGDGQLHHTMPKSIQVSSQGAHSVAYRRDGNMLATTSRDGLVRLWDPHSGALLADLSGHRDIADGVVFSPDGSQLISAGLDGQILFWDVATREVIATLRSGGHLTHKIALSQDGRLLATGGDGSLITLWDVPSRTKLATLAGHTQDVQEISFSPDGTLLASAGGDGRVLLWDVPSRSVTAELIGHSTVVRGVAFSPDGRFLASSGLDQTVIVWQVDSRTRWATLTGHNDVVPGLDFSPDSRLVASASGDHTVVVWPLDPAQAVSWLQDHNESR